MPGAYLFGWTGAAWVKALVDAAGNLQVDITASALPTGAATEATLADVESAVDGIEALLAGGLPLALDGLSLKVAEQGTPAQHCYGWDGAAWQTLLVESAAQKNLRVKLYDGANGITSKVTDSEDLLITDRGLVTLAALYAEANAIPRALQVESAAQENLRVALYQADREASVYQATLDNWMATNYVQYSTAMLMGYDGAAWDRLRTYGTGILKVGRAEVGLSTALKVAVGAVKASAGKLYWVTMNGGAGNTRVELSDDLDGSTAAVYALQCLQNCVAHVVLDPPMEFATGIWLKTFTNATDTIFGYL